MRPTARFAVGVAFALFLAGSFACAAGNPSSPQNSSQTPTTATAAPIATPPPPPTLRPGDPPIYMTAIARFQLYLAAWATGNADAMKAMLEPDTSPTGPEATLIDGATTDYQPAQYISNNEFTLLVTFQLQLAPANSGAWGEGVNSRFVTFKRTDTSSPFLMRFATSPPVALPE